ncbi:MAG: hypothetical protein K8F52_10965 [Candidatus Scalindua rubra]|nr:hypothetical protein [Candidatus Scalindua rubra]TWU28973.1 hypothetical protein S225a_26830 [Candidatus Brocadiaceae bacterium S225]
MEYYDVLFEFNLREERKRLENGIVGDTIHHHAYSRFETVKYKDGREQKKSQSKLTKKCRCQDRDKCDMIWY